jgi:hypothetical protein
VKGAASTSGATAVFQAATPLALLSRYRAKVTTDIRDTQNGSLAADYSWILSTRDGSWGSQSSSMGIGQGNHIAVDAIGHALVTFSQNAGTGYKVYASRYVGGGWSSAVAIEPTAQISNALDSSTGMEDTGDAVTVWTEVPDSGSSRVWANYMAPNGTWGTPVFIDSGSTASNPLVAMNATGTAYAVWTFADVSGRKHIYSARFTVAEGWSAALPVSSDNTSDADNARIAVDAAGYGYALWEQGGNIQFSRYVSSWSSQVAISSGGSSDQNARIAVNASGAALATWNRGLTIMAASNPGNGWIGLTTIYTETNSNPFAELAIDWAGNGFATWQVYASRTIDVLRFDASSHQWGTAPQPAAPSFAGDAQEQSVMFDPSGNALLAWSETNGPQSPPDCVPPKCVSPNNEIRVNRYQAYTNTWLGPNAVTSDPTSHYTPQIAIAPDGTAALVCAPVITPFLFR